MNNVKLSGLIAATVTMLSLTTASADDKKQAPVAAVVATPVVQVQTTTAKTCSCPCAGTEHHDSVATQEHHETVTTHVTPPVVVPAEVKTASPTPHHVWTPGTWFWNGVKHLWVTGYWRLPPAPGHTWSAAKWVCTLGKCVHTPGRWVTPTGTVLHQPHFYVGVHADRTHGRPAVVVTATVKHGH